MIYQTIIIIIKQLTDFLGNYQIIMQLSDLLQNSQIYYELSNLLDNLMIYKAIIKFIIQVTNLLGD